MKDLLQRIYGLLDSARLGDNLEKLFCETLLWGAPKGLTEHPVTIGTPVNATLRARPIAQLSGLPVFRVD